MRPPLGVRYIGRGGISQCPAEGELKSARREYRAVLSRGEEAAMDTLSRGMRCWGRRDDEKESRPAEEGRVSAAEDRCCLAAVVVVVVVVGRGSAVGQ